VTSKNINGIFKICKKKKEEEGKTVSKHKNQRFYMLQAILERFKIIPNYNFTQNGFYLGFNSKC
jgi:hypothetical protein